MSLVSEVARRAQRFPIRPAAALVRHPAQVHLPRLVLEVVARTVMGRGDADVQRIDTMVQGHRVRGEWVVPPTPLTTTSVVLYLHGSGYALLSPRTYRGFVTELGSRSARPVFALRYRMGPEHRFPAGADDALAAYRWLLSQGYADIAVSGDSAGGHLALGLCLQLAELRLPMPSSVTLFAPLVDHTFGLAAERHRVSRDPIASPRTAARIVGWYFRGADVTDYRVAPLTGDLSGLPPLLVQSGALEMLAADAAAITAAVQAQGGYAEHREWPGCGHGFYIAYRVLPEAAEAIEQAATFIRRGQTSISADVGS